MGLGRNIKRVMLIFPPSTSLSSWEPMVTTPMGIAYLAAALREAGYEVSCLDAVAEAAYQETPVADHISRYGLTYDQIMERVREARPDLVGISAIFSNQWPAVRELANRIKALDPDLTVAGGGAHPTFLSERCMMDAPVDYILRGESEHSLVALLGRLNNGGPVDEIDGLVWRERGSVRQNPKTQFIHDLDSLPFPAHDLLPSETYFKLALPMGYSFRSPRNLPVVTSRGCPCSCTFCSSTNLWGSRYRTRSVAAVMKELDWLVDRFKIGEIKFQDDNLTVDRGRAIELFQAMIGRPWRLFWNTPNGIAVWTLDEELMALMKRSGCYDITMAIESGNQEVLRRIIKKPLKLEKVREVNAIARRLGIGRGAYFIIGLPGETRAQIMDTVNFERELRLDFHGMFIYNPLPGSELYAQCLREGAISEDNFFEQGNQYFSSVIDTPEWTAEELEKIIRREYLRNYLAMIRSPGISGRRYWAIIRHRPSAFKYFFLRSLRTVRLHLKNLAPPGSP